MTQKKWIYKAAAVMAAAAMGAGGIPAAASETAAVEATDSTIIEESVTSADGMTAAEILNAADALSGEEASESMDLSGIGLTEEDSGEITLAITGDILLSYVKANYDAGGLDGIICTSL